MSSVPQNLEPFDRKKSRVSLAENGPCSVVDNGDDTKPNPYGWNSQANLVYVDQPAGTGFSYSDQSGYDHNETQVAEDMFHFFQAFYDRHPEYLPNGLFIVGESYGGHYAPAVSHRVYVGNKKGEGKHHIPLKGVAVGNGLTDPLVQYKYYPELAYNYSISKLGHPIVSESTYSGMVASWPKCQKMISQCQQDTSECSKAQSYCNDAMISPYEQTGHNPYDIRKMCNYQPLCYNMQPVTNFLTNQTVVKKLGTEGHKWSVCNFEVNSQFSNDWMKNFQQDLAPMLEDGIPVLIYAGDVDFICNWLGNKAWTLDLDWSGKSAFNNAGDNSWKVKGEAAGEVRSAKGLTFLRVYNAGHVSYTLMLCVIDIPFSIDIFCINYSLVLQMVPQDQPQAALQMINTLITQSPWQ